MQPHLALILAAITVVAACGNEAATEVNLRPAAAFATAAEIDAASALANEAFQSCFKGSQDWNAARRASDRMVLSVADGLVIVTEAQVADAMEVHAFLALQDPSAARAAVQALAGAGGLPDGVAPAIAGSAEGGGASKVLDDLFAGNGEAVARAGREIDAINDACRRLEGHANNYIRELEARRKAIGG